MPFPRRWERLPPVRGEAISGVEGPQFVERPLLHRARPLGEAVEVGIVDDHEMAVRAPMQVQFHRIGADPNGVLERGERVLGSECRGAPVADDPQPRSGPEQVAREP